jgi:hypothetical protein
VLLAALLHGVPALCTALVAQPHHRDTTVEGLGALCALFRLSTHALALCGLSGS